MKSILIKTASDVEFKEALGLCESGIAKGVSGFIIANTSTDYGLLNSNHTLGDVSGKLITQKDGEFFHVLSEELSDKTLFVAGGGIDSAKVAYGGVRKGANLVQVFTELIFKGPSLVKDINKGLMKFLKKDGFLHISEIVGVELR